MHRFPPSRALLMLAAIVAALASGCGADSSTPGGSPAETESANSATVEFVTFSSLRRLTPNISVDGKDVGRTIELEAARGEREGAQLVVWATKGEPRVVLDATALTDTDGRSIAASHVHLYIEHVMRVERGSPAGRSGEYTDPLIPAKGRPVVLGPDQRLLAWVDVTVPLATRPSLYRGAVQIRRATKEGRAIGGDAGILARVPVRLRVRNATIPHIPTLESHVGFDQSQLIRFEGVEPGSTKLRRVTERYATMLARARLSIADVGALPPGALPGHRAMPGDAAYLRRTFDRRGVASVRIPFYLDYPFADPLGGDRPEAVAYLRRVSRWAHANGWGDRAHVFAIDEPDESRAGEVRELHELVREADPRLKLLVTREASAREFAGSVDIWAPNISPTRFRQRDVIRERRAGRDTWWYPSITTWQPYPTLFIDELRPTPRALGWLAWQRGIRGFLYWSATHWHEVDNPYEDPATYNETDAVGNGDGVLVYPGGPIGLAGTPVPSVRLLQLRDGIEDHDLLTVAACAQPSSRSALRAAARAAAPAMDRIDPTDSQVRLLRARAFGAIERAGNPSRCRTAAP